MEKTESQKVDRNNEVINDIQNEIIVFLKWEVIKVFNDIYESYSNEEKIHFNELKIKKLDENIKFVININSVKTHLGDFSTNSLLKFYHVFFNTNDENFKEIFIKKYEIQLEKDLNLNNKLNQIEKYKITDHYINI